MLCTVSYEVHVWWQIDSLQRDIDDAYRACFKDVDLEISAEDIEDFSKGSFKQNISEATFGEMGRSHPQACSCCQPDVFPDPSHS